jgi:membrane protease YdiL (CAAX protease family)
VIILSIVIQILVAFALLPQDQGGWGILDPDVSPSYFLAIGIIPALVIGIGVMVLSDLEMRKKKILFAPKKRNMSYTRSLMYLPPLLGLYYGILLTMRFFINQIYGPRALVPINQDIFRIDGQLIDAARFWIFLTEREKILTLVAFIALYVGLEFLLRGLIANEARSYGLGAGGIVFVPAIIQATAFSSGNYLLTDPVYYFYSLSSGFILGLIIGIVMWRTGRFSTTITIALLARMLDHTLDFQTTLLNLLPEAFGGYNPADNTITTADEIGSFLLVMEFILIFFAPFFMFANYKETWKIISVLWDNIKKQWFGYLVLGFAFFLIDIIFSYFFGINPFLPFVGFVLAILVIGFVLNYLFKVLPTRLDLEASVSDFVFREFPVDIVREIDYIERAKLWYENPKLIGLIGSFTFSYILFITAAYRNLSILSRFDQLKFVVFLFILPTVMLGISSYLISKAYFHGHFFAESWRKTLLTVMISLYFVNLYIWGVSGSIASFSWRNIPFFIVFVILITPKPLRTPLKDFSYGFQGSGRYATYRYIDNTPKEFILEYENLSDLDSEAVQIAIKIMGAKVNLLSEYQEIDVLRDGDYSRGTLIGSILALGILGTAESQSILLRYLENEDTDIKLASYWALGKVGSPQVLGRMAQLLESNPLKSLIPVAEKAILSIDPNYPLSGLRENVLLE